MSHSAPAAEKPRQWARVLHVIDSLDLGGAQVVVENLVRHADRERFIPDVAVLHGRGVFTQRLEAAGAVVHSLSPAKWLPLYVPRLMARLATQRYDIVHCHLLGANLVAKPIAALLRARVRINHDHCNDKSTLSPLMRRMDRWANQFSTHVIAVSESTREALLAEGVAADRVTTIHNGLDLERYRPQPARRSASRAALGIPGDAFVIGGVGRLAHQKNFALFLEVARTVCAAHPSARFVIAGTGPDEAALRAQIAEHGLGERARLLGFVADPAELYAALDVLLLTSRYEGLPMTILEAMACGAGIVASDLDGMREILTNGTHATLVGPSDAPGFARGVGELLQRPELLRARTEAALELARHKFSAEAMTRSVEAVYDRYLRS